MKKVPTRNSQTENTSESIHERDNSVGKSVHGKNHAVTSLNLNSVESNMTTGLDSAHEKKILKPSKKQDSLRGSDIQHLKLVNYIKEMFLDIRQKTIDESSNTIPFLKNSVPFEEPDEFMITVEPIQLLQYIRLIFEKTLELKLDAEQELSIKAENECSDYEALLQKLEAEVRQHIRVEQQLKLYVESVQSRLDEQEKDGEASRNEEVQKEVEGLQQENVNLVEKIKTCESQIKELRKKLNRKVEMIEKLESQIENIPRLKKMVKEMDKLLDGGQSAKSINESTLRASGRSLKEDHSHTASNASYSHELRPRKSSQPVLGFHGNELRSNEKDKMKESSDPIRIIDASLQMNEKHPKIKDLPLRRSYKEGNLKDGYSGKSSARQDRYDDGDDRRQQRKSTKGDSNRTSSKERRQEYDHHNDEMKGLKSLLQAKIKEDMIEPSKFSYEAAFKMGMEDFLRKSFDKMESKDKKGKNSSILKKSKGQVNESKEKSENLRIFSHKNSIGKATRPNTALEKAYNEFAQHSVDHHFSDIYKVREGPSKKIGHDRSQSVDPKKKSIKQQKSKGSIHEDDFDDRHHHRKQSSFIQYKGSGFSKVNESRSGIFSKGHN